MKALVLGGTRYVGKIVVEQLLERGVDVTVVSRGNNRPKWISHVAHVEGDRRDVAVLRRLQGAHDVVIDFVGYRLEDVQLTIEVLRGNIGQYIFMSSTSVYDPTDLDVPLTAPIEESALDLLSIPFSRSDNPTYAQGKRDCEKWLLSESDFPCTIFRPPKIFGPDEPSARIWWWIQRAADGGPFLVPKKYINRFQFVFSKDVADAVILSCGNDSAFERVFNVAGLERFDVSEWLAWLGKTVGENPQLVWKDSAEIESNIGEYSIPLYSYEPYTFDTSAIQTTLGWSPTPVSEWLRETANWYFEAYRGKDSHGYSARAKEMALASNGS